MIRRVLAIETSCDDTSVAIVNHDGWVESVSSAAQDLAHRPFGGIVPEVAGRQHLEALLPMIDQVVSKSADGWAGIGGIVVTNRPGLLGSLMVGVVTAKSLAMAKELPLIGVNHLEGHIFAPFLRDKSFAPPATFDFPFLSLAVSGGHTTLYLVKALGDYVVLGATRDDAAGEAYDKFAKLLGLGFPGGVEVDRLAQGGNPLAFSFPKGMMAEGELDFSFSGVKASAQRLIFSLSQTEKRERLADLCASFQEAVAQTLVEKLSRGFKKTGCRRVSITGGVSANSRLRRLAEAWAEREKVELVIPPIRYCTDNAAMIGLVGVLRLNRGERDGQMLSPSPDAVIGDFRSKDRKGPGSRSPL